MQGNSFVVSNGLGTRDFPWHDFLTSVSGLAAIVEFALAGWLIFGSDRRLAWIASAAMLILFCGLNLYWHLIGKSSCECLGFLKIEPLWMLCIDVVLLAIALCFVPHRPLAVALNGLRRTLHHEFVSILPIAFLLFVIFNLGDCGVHIQCTSRKRNCRRWLWTSMLGRRLQ